MIDKELLRLLGGSRKYIFYTVGAMVIGLIANLSITVSICYAIKLLSQSAEPGAYIIPAVCAVVGVAVRYAASRITGNLKDLLGRKAKKDLREKTYDKIVRLGVRSTEGMSIAGLTQVAMEGIEQLDLYYSSYIPQFFYAMLAPIILFFCHGRNRLESCGRTALLRSANTCFDSRSFKICKENFR